MNAAALLHMHHISKKFGEWWANHGISLQVEAGEIHALVGENGAGKSTLMKILFGLVQPDEGTIYVNGKAVSFRHPRDALQAGIGMVQQQLLIFPQLSALENIVMGGEPKYWGIFRKQETEQRLGHLCRLFGFDLRSDTPAGELSFAQRQQIELLRVLYRGTRILILDEPTSLLAPPEVARLLELLRTLRSRGCTVVFISHRLPEVFAIADRITILRKGKCAGTWRVDQTSIEQVAAVIMGGDKPVAGMADGRGQAPAPETDAGGGPASAAPILSLQRVSTQPLGQETGLAGFSLQVRAGEVFGLGGVVGNGQRVLAHVLAGFGAVEQGRVMFQAQEITALSAARRVRMGFRWLPANSLEEAALPELSLWENLLLGFQRDPSLQARGWLQKARIAGWTEAQLDASEVAYQRMQQPLAGLSGGNQQKLLLARTLSGRPQFVILEQPGRGLDIHAQRQLHARIKSLNEQGVTFLVLSYDLEELLSVSHRIGILYRGRLMGLVDRAEADRSLLGKWMLGLSA